MRHARGGAGLRGQDLREVNRTRTEKFAFAAYVLDVIGFLDCGGFLLDTRGRVLFLNPIAAGRLGKGLILRENRLAAMDRESDTRLQSLIELALSLTESSNVFATWLEARRVATCCSLRSTRKSAKRRRPTC